MNGAVSNLGALEPGRRHARPRAAQRRLRRGARARAERARSSAGSPPRPRACRWSARSTATRATRSRTASPPTWSGARRLYNKLHVRIAVSEAARWTCERFYGGRYRIVPNGVDLAAARPAHADRARRACEILFVGRAEERKGLPVLLRAFEALRGAGVDARLTVAGATDEEVEPLLLDAEGVHVVGRVSDEEKWRLLGEADLLCAPSLGGESFGMVLTEAFASAHAGRRLGHRRLPRRGARRRRRPARARRRPGRPRRGAARPGARPRRAARRWPRAARERAERFAWPRVADEVLEAYEDAVEMPAPATAPASGAKARLGLAAADRRPAVRPQRLPSIEPEAPRRAAGAPPCASRRGRPCSAPPPAASGWPPWRSSASASSRSAARSWPPRPVWVLVGLRAHVRVDAPARRGLARDPAGRAARHAACAAATPRAAR